VGRLNRPRTLLLGYPSHGRLVYRGRSRPLTPAQSRELGELLAA